MSQLPDRVDSTAKSTPLAASSSIRVSITFPALNAADAGAKGESPAAMRFAFTHCSKAASLGRYSGSVGTGDDNDLGHGSILQWTSKFIWLYNEDVAVAEQKNFFTNLFAPVEAFLTFIGEIGLLFWDTAKRLTMSKLEFTETVNQMAFIGVSSVPIVALTGFFSGAVFSLYLSQFLVQYGASSFVGATVTLSMTREIGPVLAGIMVAARCGSAMAAQIGTMNVTEQIDALKMLSVNPTNYLVIPRVIAAVFMLPILCMVCVWSGTAGGMLIAQTERIPNGTYITSIQQFVKLEDLWEGMAKTPVFGLIVALVACQQGLRTKNGAVGVGKSTTNSVVISMVLVYVANFLIARLQR